ncbi:Pimeloyl-ACP methyl ester carboxylesterase [Myxococcus fulvus]|uniref:Pimeloyl-ACP methyl ester carboxylesterase n=1 Tax=Myxococcus fulvus TaxID=33 RepID=A0A511TBJ6_MYXFU|nr:alpha/beta hydrolase [Myxococcus fulvus]GEN10963.1 putative dioxygenase (1H-3-hydroxy-4-oxoquinaldine 2,4-dioxygenase) [Myxococcus fulvus]SET38157.1 Pimeloyl-ACP methyl ester carboxylesterase [Myxococcus fulvus]
MPEVRSTGGARIRYDDVGEGEPTLLFIPGWCTRREVFASLVPLCSARHRVLCVDLRGHGESEPGEGDFDSGTVLEDLKAVVEASGAKQVVPVTVSHAGFWGLELRRELGAERVPQLVLLDWIVTEPPPPFLATLRGLMSERWGRTRDALFKEWTRGVEHEDVLRVIHEDMLEFSEEMWARAAREIAAAYAREGAPLRALAGLNPPTPTLHLYAQPDAHEYLETQVAFGVRHPWFHVMKLPAVSHLPSLEVPELVAAGIQALVSGRRTAVQTGDLSTPG